jgi:diamine N-acetyltransferase
LENNSDLWFVSDTKTPFSKWQIKLHIENSIYDIYTNKELRLIIIEKSSGLKCGVVDLFDFDPANHRAGLGIVINEDFRKNGLASQTLELVIDYSFKTLNINQLWCNIDTSNSVSIKLFTKFGFYLSGVLKSWKKTETGYSDVNFYQLFNKKTDK